MVLKIFNIQIEEFSNFVMDLFTISSSIQVSEGKFIMNIPTTIRNKPIKNVQWIASLRINHEKKVPKIGTKFVNIED